MQIVVANIKGGCGKSTVVAALSNVVECDIIDHDNQGTLRVTSSFSGLNVPVHPGQTTKKVVLHDTPPYNAASLKSLLSVADLILLPCRVKYPDLVALKGIVDQLRSLAITNKAIIVFNDVRKPINNTYKELKGLYDVNYRDIRRAQTELSSLVGFARVFAEPLQGKALLETKSLAKELGLLCI